MTSKKGLVLIFCLFSLLVFFMKGRRIGDTYKVWEDQGIRL